MTTNNCRNQVLTIGLTSEENELFQKHSSLEQSSVLVCADWKEAIGRIGRGFFQLIIFNAASLALNKAQEGVAQLRNATNSQIAVLSHPEAVSALLEAGADICVPTGIDLQRFFSIIMAQARRYEYYRQNDEVTPSKAPLYRGDLMIDPLRHIVKQGDAEIRLRRREFRLLEYFARNPGVVLNADQIGGIIWPSENIFNRDISKVVSNLRRKLNDNRKDHVYIETIHGVGYRFIPYK